MSRKDDLEPLGETMEATFRRLGLPDPALMSRVAREWETLGGKHWSGRSKPITVRGRTLVVEASSRSMVAFLKYGESALVEELKKHFGPGVFDSVEVVPPDLV